MNFFQRIKHLFSFGHWPFNGQSHLINFVCITCGSELLSNIKEELHLIRTNSKEATKQENGGLKQ